MKCLVDIDDEILETARERLGTSAIDATVNAALTLAAGEQRNSAAVGSAFDTFAAHHFADREQAWH